MKVVTFLSAITLITACFFPWVTIETKHLVISGIETTGTSYGKPALLHFILTGVSLLLLVLNKSWSQKTAVFFSAFNVGWANRNFAFISACQMGECPQKMPALYILITSSIVFLIGTLAWDFRRTEAMAE
jgi:hypothetical protein